ncbi:hypothetical protein [Streptomyces sp. NPDC058305]|uniref:hypothetical protein n=1 Tax=Streptomyces sp. NPDC058305 TaxID=3346438 RepID=UPI0036EE8420
MPAHWLLLESIGVEAPAEDEAVGSVRRMQGERWARVPRKAVEVVAGEQIKLGAFLDNARRRATELSEQRRAELDELGMRWS